MARMAIYVQMVPWTKVVVEANDENDAFARLAMEGNIINVDKESIEDVGDDYPITDFSKVK